VGIHLGWGLIMIRNFAPNAVVITTALIFGFAICALIATRL
jgi:hypothetical protein